MKKLLVFRVLRWSELFYAQTFSEWLLSLIVQSDLASWPVTPPITNVHFDSLPDDLT